MLKFIGDFTELERFGFEPTQSGDGYYRTKYGKLIFCIIEDRSLIQKHNFFRKQCEPKYVKDLIAANLIKKCGEEGK